MFRLTKNIIYVILFLGFIVILYNGIMTYTDWNFTNWFNLRDLGFPESISHIEPIITGLFISVTMSISVAYQCANLFGWLARKFNYLRWLV